MNQNFYNSSGFDQIQPPQYPVIHHPPQETSEEVLQARENLMKAIQTFLRKFSRIPFREIPKVLLVAWERFSKIKHAFTDKQYQPEDIQINGVSTKAITHNLPIEEPEDSLIMRDEHLSTIPEKESDEFIKSSVEDLVPIPSESEETSDNESECDVLVCEDSSPLDISADNPVIFSNPLFDSNEDFTSSDDESLFEEDVPKETFKIYLNPLFEFDDDFTSSDVNPLFNEVLEDVESEDSGDEIDAFLDLDISTEIENDFYDSEGDIIFLEKLLINNTFPNLLSEVFLDDDPRSLKDEPNFVDMVQVFDPGIHEKSFSPTFVKLTFEDGHIYSVTFVIPRIFLPYLTYSVDSPFLLSSGSEDTIFDPDISAFHFSSLKPVAYENPMVIFPFFCFCPKDKGIRGESS
ncbi:hypothetical protein Tco_0396140 [Tanacetum coccineum]